VTSARVTRVTLAPSARIAIARHVSACYPHEGCGALLAAISDAPVVYIDEAVALPNLAADARDDRFVVAPLAYAALEQKLSTEGKRRRVVGFYHSHPDSPARPSTIDLEMALGLFEAVRCIYVYAIQNVSRQGAPGSASHRLAASHAPLQPTVDGDVVTKLEANNPVAGELTFWKLNAQLTDFEALPAET